MPFTYLHVFTYSERPGTKAVTLDGAVPVELRRERNRILRELGEAKNRDFRKRLTGRAVSAVTLEHPRTALTSNFLNVQLDRDVPANRLIDVVIEAPICAVIESVHDQMADSRRPACAGCAGD
jgi:threonylcarbamoyladenosine tRNA methylthiotransferase MtaB